MKMMKKFGALLLAVAMLTVTACAGGNTETTTAETTAETTTAETTTETAAETTAAETTAETAAETTAETNAEKPLVRVMTLKGPTGMGMAKLMKDDEDGVSANDYEFTVAGAPDEVTAAVIAGTVDVAAVPGNLAAVLYAKTEGDIEFAAINTLGNLYMLENGNTINSIEDLRGKTIYATGQGSTPEYVLRYILSKNNIDPDKDVTIEYYTEHTELSTLMTAGDIALGMLPVPNVTSVLVGNENVRIALNLNDEWDKASGGESLLIMGGVIVNKAYAESNKAAFDAFLDEYKASVEYVNGNVDDASALIEHFGIIPKAAVAKKAIPDSNITYIDGDEMKTALTGFYNVLFAANPKSVGGSVPNDEFFYKK